jgi:inosine-uridine nucleoside N-ribohydrolase
MQFPGMGRPATGVIFDCDMGAGVDDALALALLYALEGKNECRVVSISTSKPNLKSAALCEVIARFYAGAASGAFGAMGRTLPVGMALKGGDPADTPMLTVPLARKAADGAPVYPHGISKLTDTAECPALIRNAFTSQHDQNAIVVLVGPATNLAEVLALPDAKGWIDRKVKHLTVMGGNFAGGEAEFNIKADIAAAKRLFSEWPTPIVVSGFEIGEQVLYPASSIEKDFAWATDHPVVDAYRAYQKMPYDAPTWDLTAVLQAVRPQENYFKLSEPGRVVVHDDGRTTFTPEAGGRHRYLILDPAQKERIVKTYVELVSAKPVPRPQRFRRPQVDQQEQTPPPKPAVPKPVP